MKFEKIYKVLNKIIHIVTPLLILFYAYILNLNYNTNDDPGGWGSLALGGNIIISIGWILAVLFIPFIFNVFLKSSFSKGIIKLIISILNIIIWSSNTNFLVQNYILIIINMLLVILMGILLFINKNRLCEVN